MNNTRYTKSLRSGGDFDLEIIDERPGILVLRVSGKGARQAMANEPGGHRWQRIPSTEKNGRRHTSTITVAVLSEAPEVELQLNERDLEWHFSRGSGAGGQHKNKTDSAVQLIHKPTGLTVRADSRSQPANKEQALKTLKERLIQRQRKETTGERERNRKGQVGSGMRGDKVRTVCVHKGIVHDHATNKKTSYRKYEKGEWDDLLDF
jgi:peptide chain release factor 1